MGRLWKYILVDLALAAVWGWVTSESSGNMYQSNPRVYSEEVYRTPQVQRIEEEVAEYEKVPYRFNSEDLKAVFKGIYNNNGASIEFSNVQYSADKDTIFFDFEMLFSNSNHYLDFYSGDGYIVSSEELIVMQRSQDNVTLSGDALKIFNDNYSSDLEDGYLLFSIADEGERLSFIDKRWSDEIKQNY
ncbi:hypothetical protein [Flagellimonas sp. S3867]|uniref:hypothetical protein n=1 Tax=Flagellimonas sp. S3867 TaxID=2768063 RepID=UPI001689B116|nr:hypothetical protein [Flagellimonas sp. S3867]